MPRLFDLVRSVPNYVSMISCARLRLGESPYPGVGTTSTASGLRHMLSRDMSELTNGYCVVEGSDDALLEPDLESIERDHLAKTKNIMKAISRRPRL